MIVDDDYLFLKPAPVISVHHYPGFGRSLVVDIPPFNNRHHGTAPKIP
jgi:hypothetical protein